MKEFLTNKVIPAIICGSIAFIISFLVMLLIHQRMEHIPLEYPAICSAFVVVYILIDRPRTWVRQTLFAALFGLAFTLVSLVFP